MAQPEDENDGKDSGKGGGESTLTVLVAMGANAGIAVMKLVAGIFTTAWRTPRPRCCC